MLVELLIPLPASPTVSGLLLALLVTVKVPVRAPPAVGVNVTVTVQEPPAAAMAEQQMLVWEKAPRVARDATVAAELVGLATGTVWAALVEPVATEPKLSAVGVAFTPVTG